MPPKILTPIKAIRAWCIDCSGGNRMEVRKCEHKKCPLFPYRLGKHPKLKGRGRVGGNIVALKKARLALVKKHQNRCERENTTV